MNDPRDLTPKQRDFFLFILGSVCERQRPPTYDEMQARFRCSASNVGTFLRRLARKGWVSFPPVAREGPGGGGIARAVRVRGCTYRLEGRRLRVVCDATPAGWRLAQLLSGTIRWTMSREKAAPHFAHLEEAP